MGIFNTGRSIDEIYNEGRLIIAVYNNGRLIWSTDNSSSSKSCFSNGYWYDAYPWTDDLAWVD